MKYGVKVPTRELGLDPDLIRAWAKTAEEVGFDHIIVTDHVVGVDPGIRQDFASYFPANVDRPAYVVSDKFHEPLTLISHLAAVCTRIDFATGILIAPQRQTALLAKQAAEVDLLSGGRLRLCLGVGWNPVEYEVLGMDFATRGQRIEEQTQLLRQFWTHETVSFEGQFDRAVGVGLAPNATQKPIPLWFGGWSRKVLDRVGRIGDGWYHGNESTEGVAESLKIIAESAKRAGRDTATIGLQGALELRLGLDDLESRAGSWEELGATHVVVDPAFAGTDEAAHLDVLRDVAARLSLSG